MERADVLHLNTFSSGGTPRDTFLFFSLLLFFLLLLLLLVSFPLFFFFPFIFLSLLLLVYLEETDALENSCDEPRRRNREDVQSTTSFTSRWGKFWEREDSFN